MDQPQLHNRPSAGIGSLPVCIALGVITLVAVWLRFDGLTRRDMWLDESCTFYAVHHLFAWPAAGPDPWRELAHTPYFLLLRLWSEVFGQTAWGLRSFSAVVGSLAIPLIALVGTRMGNRRVGLIGAAIASVHPLHIYYSQEARVYTLWALAATISLYVLYQAARTLRARWWLGYAVCAWVMVLIHDYSLFWLPATIGVLVVADHRRRALRQWFITHACLALTLAPLVWFVLLGHTQTGPKAWLNEIWRGYPPALAVARSLWALLPSGDYPRYLGTLYTALDVIGAYNFPAAYAVLVGPAILVGGLAIASAMIPRRWIKRVPSDDPLGIHEWDGTSPRCAQFLVVHGLLFLFFGFLYSCLFTPTYVVGRYDVVIWPAMVLGMAFLVDTAPIGRRLDGRPRIFLQGAITVILCTCGLVMSLASRAAPIYHVQRVRAERIAAFVDEADLVVSVNLYRWFMLYEWHRMDFHPQIISFPPAHDRQMCC